MAPVTHLRSLQALDMAIRTGSLKAAAAELSITPAALGQRIRALEDYLGTDLLSRGRSGLLPTAELAPALHDLRLAFDALGRVTDTLDFQRTTEIHLVVDPDLFTLWLQRRLQPFQAENPHILFCVNGEGGVPMRLGAPDARITLGETDGEELFRDRLLPVSSPDNVRRQGDFDPENVMEGMPLLHVREAGQPGLRPGWREWFEAFGQRREGRERGTVLPNMRLAVENARDDVGFLVAGHALIADDLKDGRLCAIFPPEMSLPATAPYVLQVGAGQKARPQMRRFTDWLRAEAAATRAMLRASGPDAAA